MSKNRIRNPDWKELRRYRVLELEREGWTHEEIAEALNVSTRSIRRWMKAVREEGEAGLQARAHLGARPKIAATELAWLPELLPAGAEAYGVRGEGWTCARIAGVIEWEFGISSHKAHVSRLLQARIGHRRKPLTHATQRDEEEIERWRTELWPELKKRRAAKAG